MENMGRRRTGAPNERAKPSSRQLEVTCFHTDKPDYEQLPETKDSNRRRSARSGDTISSKLLSK